MQPAWPFISSPLPLSLFICPFFSFLARERPLREWPAPGTPKTVHIPPDSCCFSALAVDRPVVIIFSFDYDFGAKGPVSLLPRRGQRAKTRLCCKDRKAVSTSHCFIFLCKICDEFCDTGRLVHPLVIVCSLRPPSTFEKYLIKRLKS